MKKRLIPIVVRDLAGEPAPAALARLNYVFFIANLAAGASGDFDQATDELTRALEINIEWIREHTRLGLLARRWDAHGRPHEMELRGEELSRAETWLTTRPKNAPDPTDTHRAYVTEGRRAATARQRRTVAMLVSVVIGALALSGLAVWQWRTAVGQRDRAVQAEGAANVANAQAQANAAEAKANAQKADANARQADANAAEAKANAEKAEANANEASANAEKATANLREAHIGQSRYLADQARQRRTADPGTAVLLALEGLPDATAGIDRPYVPEAELQLNGAWRDLRERLVLSRDNAVLSAAFGPDGTRIVTASGDRTARVWDSATGQPIGEPLRGHESPVRSAAFSPDGKRIVTASWDKTARIWDATTGRPIGEPLRGHDGSVESARVQPGRQAHRHRVRRQDSAHLGR